MFRFLLPLALLLASAGAALAACGGRDLLAGLDPEDRVELERRAYQVPYPSGNLWQAERAGQVVHVVGTFHVGDPRLDAVMQRLAPLVAEAELVLVEATPEEEQRLAAAMAADPAIAYITEGPTLRDMLTAAEWDRFAAEMSARGIPAFVASRFQPWLAFSTLGVPACAMGMPEETMRGLDDRIITYAEELGVPVRGLEGYEIIHALFDTLTEAEKLEILRSTLIQAELSEDMFATLANAYFAEEHRLIWEFSRSWPGEGADTESLAAMQDVQERLEEALLLRRNRDWLEKLGARTESRILLAVGAAHLSGTDGVLDLLDRTGFTLRAMDF